MIPRRVQKGERNARFTPDTGKTGAYHPPLFVEVIDAPSGNAASALPQWKIVHVNEL